MSRTERTPQEMGMDWERELARLVGGRIQPGSGNLIQARGDVSGDGLLWTAKHTIHLSSPVTKAAIEDARTMASGPSLASMGAEVVFGYQLGDGTMRADLSLLQLIAWLREPPALIAATKQDSIRHTARTPSALRD